MFDVTIQQKRQIIFTQEKTNNAYKKKKQTGNDIKNWLTKKKKKYSLAPDTIGTIHTP